ncbi:MAG: di-trans,poly-cis-decaprenylcistransferase [Candidatus Saccharibacteria bacterium]|nr:di-trans,poly-cis-decaprenylcistransferase [Candidatus Saccharibacteria bacterium]
MNSDTDYSQLKIPTHVAIIVDGNGRWAKERGLLRLEGHNAGFKNLQKLIPYIMSRGVKVLSLYVFSTENFKRAQEEVGHLMDLFVAMYKKELKTFNQNNLKVIFSGRDNPLPKSVIKARNELVEMTKNNTGGIVNFCMNYGGRAEIMDAVKKIAHSGVDVDSLTDEDFRHYLYQDLPDVDLMIRTSGELRLSNFLLWQNSYAEFYFPKTKFPDFGEKEFDRAIMEYTSRDRRFGGIKNN